MQLVIFDFDGTIADSSDSIALCMNDVLEALGREPLELQPIKDLIGLPLKHSFETLVPDLPDHDRAVELYRERYAAWSVAHTEVYEGMRALLDDLHAAGRRLAIATGKSTRGAHRSMARLNLKEALFEMILGHDAVANPKPHPDMVEHILETLGVAPSDAVVVGDTTFDITMGARAGVAGCGVTWGSHEADALREAGARWIVETRPALRALLFDE